ncbi:MAG: integrase core domain-containing protein [Candidatus Kaiserbacteria bacterium]|nr:integrase core domain-containing protein [Candidatus Kaiserbacteria bacterium]
MMKTLNSSLRYESTDPTKFRLHVLEYGKKHGVKATLEAFRVGRSTYYEWRQAFTQSKGKLVSLVPRSTRPHNTRRMVVDERLLALIKSVREQYGRIGKEKLKVLVAAYADSLGIPGYSAGKIGKIIKRQRYFFDITKQKHRIGLSRYRVKKVGKDIRPGYVEIDSVIVYLLGKQLRFVTMVDVVTKVAYAERVKNGKAHNTVHALHSFESRYAIPIYTVQTDNGSEFLGDFHDHLEHRGIIHLFTYPHCPKINGVVERFNRTIQEEFIERFLDWNINPEKGDLKLSSYLSWYNEVRPHASLKYLTPQKYAEQYTKSPECM